MTSLRDIWELKQRRIWAMRVNRKWSIFPFNMPWSYKICIFKCLFSHRDDSPEKWSKSSAKIAKRPLPVDVCRNEMKRRPCCFSKPVLWELSSFCISKLLFVAINIGIAADNVRQNALIQNCLGFWIFNVDSISVKLGFQIPIVSGIPDSLSTILYSKA